MAGGKDTQEYETIRKNMVKITTALAGVAERALLQAYIARNWIDANVKEQTGQELVVVALGRIELDNTQYREFLSMLRGINGMDLILNILTGKIISNVTITNFAIFFAI